MTTTSNKPSHRIYAVSKRKSGDKNDWTEIGAAWAHQDGKGFSLKLDYLPLNGAELSLRVPMPKDAAGTTTSDQDNAPSTEGGY